MTDLPEFLLARIAEDEEMARAADDAGDVAGYSVEPFDEAPILTVGPGRVLAECEAKRRIVASETEPWDTQGWGPDGSYLVINGRTVRGAEEPITDTPVLRLLAMPYADHPDYREEWRP